MEHLDARAVRERLHTVTVALVTLEEYPTSPRRVEIAQSAFAALQEIAAIVTVDEKEEQGESVRENLLQVRDKIRRDMSDGNSGLRATPHSNGCQSKK